MGADSSPKCPEFICMPDLNGQAQKFFTLGRSSRCIVKEQWYAYFYQDKGALAEKPYFW
jgi:hypothetical protein